MKVYKQIMVVINEYIFNQVYLDIFEPQQFKVFIFHIHTYNIY